MVGRGSSVLVIGKVFPVADIFSGLLAPSFESGSFLGSFNHVADFIEAFESLLEVLTFEESQGELKHCCFDKLCRLAPCHAYR
jgi:hypothetical protein